MTATLRIHLQDYSEVVAHVDDCATDYILEQMEEDCGLTEIHDVRKKYALVIPNRRIMYAEVYEPSLDGTDTEVDP